MPNAAALPILPVRASSYDARAARARLLRLARPAPSSESVRRGRRVFRRYRRAEPLARAFGDADAGSLNLEPGIEPVPSHPVVFGPRCETTLTLTPATPVFRLTTLVRLTTVVRPGVVTVVEGPGTVTVWLGLLVVTDTVVGRVTVTVVVAPPVVVVVVVPVVVFAVVDQATPPVAESVSKAAVPTPPRTRAAAIMTTRIFLNSSPSLSLDLLPHSPELPPGLPRQISRATCTFAIAQSR